MASYGTKNHNNPTVQSYKYTFQQHRTEKKCNVRLITSMIIISMCTYIMVEKCNLILYLCFYIFNDFHFFADVFSKHIKGVKSIKKSQNV